MLKFKKETNFKQTEIGEVPRDWEVKKIGHYYKLKYGITASSSHYGNCRLLRQTDLKDGFIEIENIPYTDIDKENIEKFSLKEGDLVISRIANVGSVGYIDSKVLNGIDSPLVFGSYLLKLEKLGRIYNKFTFYFLYSQPMQHYIKSIAEGSTRPNTNAKVVSQFPLLIPPPPEQSRIATVLSWFDDLIENKKRQNEILEKTAMAIFKSWFIDFEPFKDGEFVYSEELGKEIPKGWEVRKIGEIADFTNGLSYKGSEKFDKPIDDSYVFVTLNNIKEGGGFKTEFAWIKSNRLKERHFVKEGELVFANTEQTKSGRLLATPAFVVFPDGYNKSRAVYSHHITKVSLKNGDCKTFLYLTFRIYQEDIAQTYHTGTGVWGFDIKNFRENFLIPIPPPSILQRFHSLVEPLFQKIILNQKQIMVLRKIRDALLPKLVFGKIRVMEI